MNPIRAIQDLENAVQQPSSKTPPAADGPLGAFEKVIDKIVARRQQLAKLIAQANQEKARVDAQKLAEYRRELAFLSSEAQEAELQSASLAGSNVGPEPSSNDRLFQFKHQEAVYWESKARQLAPPADHSDPLTGVLEP